MGSTPDFVSCLAARRTNVLPLGMSAPSGGVVSAPEVCFSQPISSAPATVVWRTASVSQSPSPNAASSAAVSFFVVFDADTSANERRQRMSLAGTADRPPVGTVVNVRQSLPVTPFGMSHVTRTRRAAASTVSMRRFVGVSARTASSVIVTFARIQFPTSFV